MVAYSSVIGSSRVIYQRRSCLTAPYGFFITCIQCYTATIPNITPHAPHPHPSRHLRTLQRRRTTTRPILPRPRPTHLRQLYAHNLLQRKGSFYTMISTIETLLRPQPQAPRLTDSGLDYRGCSIDTKTNLWH